MEAQSLDYPDELTAEPLAILSRPRLRLVEPLPEAPVQPASREAASDESLYRRFGKRALDVTLGLPLLLMATPAIAALAAGVVVSSGWPPFHVAKRLGRDGREFSMIKLRSMVCDAESQLEQWTQTRPELAAEYFRSFKLESDPRITAFGHILRRSSLDELPQLWNVLRGDMSLVGPRPIVASELSHYGSHADELLRVRPGLTGLWQTGGRSELTYPERVWVELQSCRMSSLKGDLKIILRTALAPLKFNGR